MKKLSDFSSYFLVVLFSLHTFCEDVPIATTENGRIKGVVMKTLKGREFKSFRKIPYAQPPLGPLRFMEPEEPKNYAEILDGTKDSEDCIQHDVHYNSYPLEETNYGNIVGSEDCLYLNIYTPTLDSSAQLPVLFFIHGGAFAFGAGSSKLHGPELMLDEDVVLVAINYRLGSLGFLSLEDNIYPGNIGLKDQVAALKWVNKNIQNFGGSPKQITIFGESAGAASVHLHMHSHLSEGLFSRAISQSGNMYCPWALSTPGSSKVFAHELAKILGCPTESEKLLSCFQGKSVEDILNASLKITGSPVPLKVTYKPVLEEAHEGAFITKGSIYNTTPVPWLSGVTSNEGMTIIDEIIKKGDKSLENFNEDYKSLLPKILYLDEHSKSYDDITENIKKFYLGKKAFSEESLDKISDLFGDPLFTYPHYIATKKHKGNLYMYYLTHKSERTFSQIKNISLKGPNHADDLFSLFYLKKFAPSSVYNDIDSKVSELMIKSWVTFAKFGQPSSKQHNIDWEKSNKNHKHFKISSEGFTMEEINKEMKKRMEFWKSLKLEKLTLKDEPKHIEL